MAGRAEIRENFSGGWSIDPKLGFKNSQAYTQALDFRKSPSQLTVLPAPTREDAGVVKDLVLNEVMASNGNIFAFGNAGYFYKRTTAGAWSVEGVLTSGCAGIDYRRDSDAIYLASNKTVSLYDKATAASVLYPDKYAASASTYNNTVNTGFNVSANQQNSVNTTLITTSISEGDTQKRFFQTDIEPMNKLQLFIVTKGSGNWTVTIHDGLNNVLATATVSNANLTSKAWNDFTFSSATNGQVRLYVAPNARTYHIHVTSTVADGTVSSLNVNDLASCDLQIWADRLIQTNNGLHPIQRFLQYECFGNANYLSVWEPLTEPPTNVEWQRHRLVFPQEYETCGLAVQNEFIIVAAEKTTSVSTATPQEGILFFWDGLSDTYNYFVPVPEGSPQGLHVYKNVAYYYSGGAWWAITSPTTEPVKLRTMPGSDTEFSGSAAPIVVYPYAATVRRGIHLMAYPCTSTSTSINFGVYSWGAVDKNFPDTFGYNYVISTGSQTYSAQNNLSLGMVQSFGDTLHISWRDDLNGGYGVDVVTNSSKPAPTASWQSLITDSSYASKPKDAWFVDAYYSLPAGATITLKYKLDRATDWTSSDAYSTTNLWEGHSNYARFNVSSNARYHEAQYAFDIACDSTVTTPPVVYTVSWAYEDLKNEQLGASR